MIAKIPFNLIKVNSVDGRLEVVFPYGSDFYRCDWEDVPDRFKELYVLFLRLSGCSVPEYFEDYVVDIIDVEDLDIEFDLDKCGSVPLTYPVEVSSRADNV